MTPTEKFDIIFQEIIDLLNSKNIDRFFISLAIKDQEELTYNHFYKKMNNIEIDYILKDRKDKIKDEFNQKDISSIPLTISNTKAKA